MRHKFRAERDQRDGFKFASKLEARCYDMLKLQERHGDIQLLLMQVPFHLPGSVKYVADFLVLRTDGAVEVIDAKGVETPTFRAKRKLVEQHHGIRIRTWNDR